MDVDFSGLRKFEVLIAVTTTCAALIYGYLLVRFRTEFATAAKVTTLEAQIKVSEQRLENVEAALRHLPSREDTHQLALSLADLRGDLRSVAARLDGIEKVMSTTSRRVELIDEHLKAAR